MSKLFLSLGLSLCLIGVLYYFGERLGLQRLPGNIEFKTGGTTVIFPLATCIVLSVLLSVIMRFFNRQ